MIKMKDSKIEWIGEIPDDWEVSKIKREYSMQTGWTPSTEIEENFIGENIWVNISDIKEKTIFDSVKHISNDAVKSSSMNISPKGSLLFSFKLSVGAVTFCGTDLYTNEAIATFLPNTKNSLNYLYYIAPIFIIKNANENIYGAKILNQKLIKNAKIILPPLATQTRIADFLDAKCAKIDFIIQKQQTIIEKLKEYKQSLITQTVTKGLNKNAKLKDSGIEWIGEIPEEWEVRRLKYFVNSFSKGNGITKDDIVLNGDISCVRYGEIYTKYNFHFDKCITKTNLNLISPQKYFSYGDILFTCTGELVEEIGKAIVYLGKEDCLAGGDIIIAKHEQNPLFMSYLLNSDYVQKQKSLGKTKLKVVHISASEIANISIALPPLAEQKQIADFLDAKCDAIDSSIAKKQAIIEKLASYKKSLIYEVVTGKKQV